MVVFGSTKAIHKYYFCPLPDGCCEKFNQGVEWDHLLIAGFFVDYDASYGVGSSMFFSRFRAKCRKIVLEQNSCLNGAYILFEGSLEESLICVDD